MFCYTFTYSLCELYCFWPVWKYSATTEAYVIALLCAHTGFKLTAASSLTFPTDYTAVDLQEGQRLAVTFQQQYGPAP